MLATSHVDRKRDLPVQRRGFPKLALVAGTLGQGGAERQLYYILKALREDGADVRLLSLTRGEFWEEPIRQLGVPVVWVGESQSRVRRLFRIIAAARADLPQVIQSAHFFTNLYVAGAGRVLGVPEIGAIRNNVTSEVGDDWLGRMSLRRPRWLAANSLHAVRTAEGLGVPAGRCAFLPNVVDTTQFTRGTREEERPVTLLAVGRLVQQKRVDRFLRVVREVRNRSRQPIRAVVVGDGPKRAELERYARENLGGTVEFRGAMADLVPAYHEADLLVLTSDWEGTPNVVMEAMACGLPVVSTHVGGVPELVRAGETGLLAAAEDEAALVEAVVRLVEDATLRSGFGANARNTIVSEHSLENLTRNLEALYQRVLG